MTALWTPQALLEATGGLLLAPFSAHGVAIDSRTLRPGQMFVALVGENGDGHAHVAAALRAGASGAVVHAMPADVGDDAPLLVTADSFAALQDLGRFGRNRFAGRLAAITGSVGKTTTKEMLRTILQAQSPAPKSVWAAEASHNNHWGVPLTLARLPPGARYAVAEIGMNHAGEIAPLARMARPHVAVVTTIAAAHIGHLGSLEAIADEKASIAQGLEPGGVLLLPADSPLLARMSAATTAEVQSFGRSAAATHRLLSAQADAEGTQIAARIAGTDIAFRLGTPGLHMALNAIAALAAASLLGADPVAGARALAGFTAMAGRGARRVIRLPPERGPGSATLIDESYNASAVTVRAALALLGLVPATRRVAVLGDMLELGTFGPAEHAGLAPDVEAHADLLFTCGPLMRGLYDAIPPSRRGAHAASSEDLAPIVLQSLRPGDAVLVKGSLGSRMKKIVDALDAANAAGADTSEDAR